MDPLNKESRKEIDFEYIFDISPDLIFILDNDQNIICANQALVNRLGVSPEVLAGSKCFWCMHQKDEPPSYCVHKQILIDGKEHTAEIFIDHLDGWYSVTAKPMLNNEGRITGSIHIARNIADAKKTEDALMDSLSLTRGMLDSIHNGILVISKEGTVVTSNAKFAELWHIPADVLASADDKILLDFVLGQLDDPDEFTIKIAELYERPDSESFDLIYFMDGRVFERISKPLYHRGEPKGRVWSFLDVTERERVKDGLQKSEQRNRSLIENMGDGVGFINEREVFVFANSSAERIFGVEKGGLTGVCINDFLTDDGIEIVKNETQKRQHRESSTYEHQIVLKDGSKKDILATATPSFDGEQFLGTFAVFHDISNRKTMEKALRDSEEKFKALFESAVDGIFQLTENGDIIAVNESFASMHGYTVDEMMQKNIKDLDTPETSRLTSERMKRILAGETMTFEVEHFCKNGQPIPIEVSTNLVTIGDQKYILGFHRDITLRKRTLEDLNNSDERYKKAQEIGQIGSWEYDIKNDTFWSSDEGLKIYGFNPETDIFSADQVMKCVIDRERVNQAMVDLIEKNEPYDLVFDIIPLNSTETKTINSIAELVRDEKGNPIKVTGVMKDITERKRVEDILLQEQYLMSALLNNIPDHIYFKDRESRFFRNNMAHALSFGLSGPDLLVGKSDFDFFIKENAQRQYEDEQQVIRTGQSITKEEFITRTDNSINWYYTTKMPFRDKDGSIVGTFGISRDITERKMAEAEIELKNQQLFKLNADKDKFFSIIAHDLRNPFNSFLGFTRMLVEELDDMTLEEIKTIVVSMRKSATNLYRLLENLLEWSMMQRGITSFNPVSIPLAGNIIASTELIIGSARKKEIEISYAIPDELFVIADLHMVETIIRNLISNAVKFTKKGGKISISAKVISNEMVEISIQDSGIGMSRTMVDNLFRLDEQTNRKGTEGEPSSGLGLIICKDFIEKNGGMIWVESEVNKGSTFYFTLPVTARNQNN